MRRLLAVAVLAAFAVASASCKGDKADNGRSSGPNSFTGRARVTGTLHGLEAAAAVPDDIRAPFTITVPEAGRGGLDMPQARVNGKAKSIVWTGGRPLPVTGDCRLIPGEIAVAIEDVSARLALDGAPRSLSGAACTFGSSVAVGEAGISSPVASVTFAAPGEAVFSTTGGAMVNVAAMRRYEGRSGGLSFTGDLTVEREDLAPAKAKRVEMSKGTWVVEVTGGVDPGTLRVVATLEGAIKRS